MHADAASRSAQYMALFRALESCRLPAAARLLGAPWTFGLDPAEVPGYLAARGLTLLDDQGACTYRVRYWGADGPHQRGYAFYHVAQAAVGAA